MSVAFPVSRGPEVQGAQTKRAPPSSSLTSTFWAFDSLEVHQETACWIAIGVATKWFLKYLKKRYSEGYQTDRKE